MSSAIDLLKDLMTYPAPPGKEDLLADHVMEILRSSGLDSHTDSKGNVLVPIGTDRPPKIVVTAHLDELALMVTNIDPEGWCSVTNLGGVQPAKWGEGPVSLIGRSEVPGILSFGSSHTEDDQATLVQMREKPLKWNQAKIFTGRSQSELAEAGIRVGTRAVINCSRRHLTDLGEYVAGYFLDDRADLAAWILILKELQAHPISDLPILFAATVSEEVGGHGALYVLEDYRPEVCIALELGPVVPDSPVRLNATPTVWVNDSYAAAQHEDLERIASLGHEVQFQALSRGGSDASCASANGLCARPVTIGIPMENTHGYEIIHRDSIDRMVELTLAYLRTFEQTD